VVADRVCALARRRGVKPVHIALAWMLSKPSITAPIVGASQLSHLDDAVESLQVQLTAEDIAFVEEPYTPHPVLGFDATPSR